MNASDVVKLLAERHKDDIFVPECHTGHFSHSKFDAWAMPKAWEKPLIIGYEVKVTRADFFQDSKWQNYLPFCNELYFVTPYKLVEPAEVPGRCGLLWASKQSTRVYSKKKSDYWPVQPDKLVNLFKYLILSRMRMNCLDGRGLEEFWTDWIEKKRSLRTLGHVISKKLYERFSEELDQYKTESDALRKELFELESVKNMLERHNIDITTGYSRTQRAVWDLINADPSNVKSKIEECSKSLRVLSEHLAKISGK